jgi:hypothetical protein
VAAAVIRGRGPARAQRNARQARWRANVRNCAAVYPVYLDAADLDWLVQLHYLDEGEIGDKQAVGKAVHHLINLARR